MGSAARSKHSDTCLRNLVASRMPRKGIVCSFTPAVR